jgi:transposase
MFIRPIKAKRDTVSQGESTYEYLQLVESYRTEKGPRQKLLLDLGPLPLHKSEYKVFVQELKVRLSGQMRLIRKPRSDSQFMQMVTDVYERLVRKQNIPLQAESHQEIRKVDTNSIQITCSRTIGPEHVCFSMWNELGLSDWLEKQGVSSEQIGVIAALVIGRLIQPGSELATKSWLENQSGLKDLIPELQNMPCQMSYYRSGDLLFSLKSKLESYLRETESNLFDLKDTIYLYDMTNTYFEGSMEANPKAQFGRSKEKRSDCKIVTLGLVVDHLGFAKNSQLFTGNQGEAATLPDMITALANHHSSQEKTIIMDAGIATADNIAWLKTNNYHYIVCHRGKPPFELAADVETSQLQSPYQDHTQLTVSRHIHENDCYLRCHSQGRQSKEIGIRTLQEQRFLAQLTHYKKKLSEGRKRSYTTQMVIIGRLKERFPKAAMLYTITVTSVPDPKFSNTPEKSIATDIVWEKKEAKHNDQLQNEGAYVLRTDRTDLTDEDIWSTYIMLTQLENAFRNMKSWLGLRPIFHSKESRTDAHLFISVIAYHIVHMIEYKLKEQNDTRSWWTIRKLLQSHQTMIMQYNELTDGNHWKKHHVTLCSEPDEHLRQIYKSLKIPVTPFKRREKIYDKL